MKGLPGTLVKRQRSPGDELNDNSSIYIDAAKMGKSSCIPKSAMTALSTCAAYAFSSMSLAMLNKALLSSYAFKGYFALLACQMAFSYAFCVFTRDRLGNPFGVPKFSAASFRASMAMGCLYVGNVVMGMIGLKLVNVPVYFAIRRLTPVLIICLEYGLYRKTVDGGTQLAVAISVLGTLVAAWETLSSDGLGYAITLANNAVTAGLMISQKRFTEVQAAIDDAERRAEAAAAAMTSKGEGAPGSANAGGSPTTAGGSGGGGKLSPFGTLYYNAMLAAPLAMALSAATGELGYIASFPSLYDGRFQAGFLISSVMGLLLTYTSVLCTTHAGPLGASMTGAGRALLIHTASCLTML